MTGPVLAGILVLLPLAVGPLPQPTWNGTPLPVSLMATQAL